MCEKNTFVYLSIVVSGVYYSKGYNTCAFIKVGYTDRDCDKRREEILAEYRALRVIPIVYAFHKRYSATVVEAKIKEELVPYQVNLYRPYKQTFTEESYVCHNNIIRIFLKIAHKNNFDVIPSIYFEGMGDSRNFEKVVEDSIEEVGIDNYTLLKNPLEDSLTKLNVVDIKTNPLKYHHDPYDDDYSSSDSSSSSDKDEDYIDSE